MSHTPGPWLVAPSEFGEQLEVIADVVSSDDKLNIASVYGGFKSDLELAANARLIAAAPELQAEIVRLRGETGHLKILLQNLLTRPTDEVVIRQARAALTQKICPECGQPMREGGYCDHIPF